MSMSATVSTTCSKGAAYTQPAQAQSSGRISQAVNHSAGRIGHNAVLCAAAHLHHAEVRLRLCHEVALQLFLSLDERLRGRRYIRDGTARDSCAEHQAREEGWKVRKWARPPCARSRYWPAFHRAAAPMVAGRSEGAWGSPRWTRADQVSVGLGIRPRH